MRRSWVAGLIGFVTLLGCRAHDNFATSKDIQSGASQSELKNGFLKISISGAAAQLGYQALSQVPAVAADGSTDIPPGGIGYRSASGITCQSQAIPGSGVCAFYVDADGEVLVFSGNGGYPSVETSSGNATVADSNNRQGMVVGITGEPAKRVWEHLIGSSVVDAPARPGFVGAPSRRGGKKIVCTANTSLAPQFSYQCTTAFDALGNSQAPAIKQEPDPQPNNLNNRYKRILLSGNPAQVIFFALSQVKTDADGGDHPIAGGESRKQTGTISCRFRATPSASCETGISRSGFMRLVRSEEEAIAIGDDDLAVLPLAGSDGAMLLQFSGASAASIWNAIPESKESIGRGIGSPSFRRGASINCAANTSLPPPYSYQCSATLMADGSFSALWVDFREFL